MFWLGVIYIYCRGLRSDESLNPTTGYASGCCCSLIGNPLFRSLRNYLFVLRAWRLCCYISCVHYACLCVPHNVSRKLDSHRNIATGTNEVDSLSSCRGIETQRFARKYGKRIVCTRTATGRMSNRTKWWLYYRKGRVKYLLDTCNTSR